MYAGLEDLRGLVRSARCLPYVLLINVLRYLPRGAARRVGRGLGRAAFWILPRYRQRSIENVLASFPAADRAWARGVGLRSMEGLGAALAQAVALARYNREELLLRLKVTGGANLEEALGGESGVVIASAHMGCWELLPAYLAARGRRVAVLARQQAGRWESDLLRRERARLGVEEVGPGVGSLRRAVRILRVRGIVVCPFDRVVAPDLGLRLSVMTRSAVLPARAYVSPDGGDGLIFERPLRVGPGGDLGAVALEVESAVNRWVRETPDQCVWLDRRRLPPAEV